MIPTWLLAVLLFGFLGALTQFVSCLVVWRFTAINPWNELHTALYDPDPLELGRKMLEIHATAMNITKDRMKRLLPE